MGANAQTTVPTFTAGAVLTAAQMNQSARTGVPVFADATARDAGFGGTGEKTLAEGQLCYLESSDVVQYYDGSNWLTLGPTAGAGLQFVSATTVGSAVSSVTISNAFSATYADYQIIYSGGTSSANSTVRMTLGSAAANYYWSWLENSSGAAGYNGNAGANVSSWSEIGLINTNGHLLIADIFQPFAAYRTIITGRTNQASGSVNRMYTGMLNDTTSYTAFTLTPATGTLTGGTIYVYGYRAS